MRERETESLSVPLCTTPRRVHDEFRPNRERRTLEPREREDTWKRPNETETERRREKKREGEDRRERKRQRERENERVRVYITERGRAVNIGWEPH